MVRAVTHAPWRHGRPRRPRQTYSVSPAEAQVHAEGGAAVPSVRESVLFRTDGAAAPQMSEAHACRVGTDKRTKKGKNKMTQEELNEVVRLHKLWLADEVGGVKADLSWVDLRWVDLRKVDLRRADMHMADLRGADLRGANLAWSDLEGADLRGSSLAWSDLEEASLNEARLEGADLRWADLRFAEARWTHLEGADLRWAEVEGTNLEGANLEGTQTNETEGKEE